MEKVRIVTPNGPGMQIFSPDGKYSYICSSFNPEKSTCRADSTDEYGSKCADGPAIAR
jgi:hypothetical protein